MNEKYKIEKEIGFEGTNGTWNEIVIINGKNYRKRVECLIIKDDKVFLAEKNGKYKIPGGSADRHYTDEQMVINECREEARINISNPIYTEIDYLIEEEPKDYMKGLKYQWVGKYIKIYIANFVSYDNRKVEEHDKDETISKGKFYPINSVINKLRKEWKDALNKKDKIMNEENNLLTLAEEEYHKGNKNPIFIITSFTYTWFGNLTKTLTKATFSHASLSLDPELHKMYSFNMQNGVNRKGGFSIEDIDTYTSNSEESYIKVNAIFVSDKHFYAIKEFIKKFEDNIEKTKYNIKHLLYVLFNKEERHPNDNAMICSEFVYNIFKLINADILNKSANLVTPQDLSQIKDKRVYTVFDGLIIDYKSKDIKTKIKKLKNSAKLLAESMNGMREYEIRQSLSSYVNSLYEEFNLEKVNDFYVCRRTLECSINEIPYDKSSENLEVAVAQADRVLVFKSNPSAFLKSNQPKNEIFNVYTIRKLGDDLTKPIYLGKIDIKFFINGSYEYLWTERVYNESTVLNEEFPPYDEYQRKSINLHTINRPVMISSISIKEIHVPIANVIMFDSIASNLLYVRDVINDGDEFYVYVNIDRDNTPEFIGTAKITTDFNCKEFHCIYSYKKIEAYCVGKFRVRKLNVNSTKNLVEKDNFNIETIYSKTIGEVQSAVEQYQRNKNKIIEKMTEEE